MNHNDRIGFAECMALLQETFTPDKPVSKTKMDLYFELFKDMSLEDFKSACVYVMRNKSYPTFPLPNDIREAANGGDTFRAEIALQMVERAVDIYGANYSVKFPDPVIHAVIVRLGGWEWLTTQKLEEWKWIRKDFVKYYALYTKMDSRHVEIPDYLVGTCEYRCGLAGIDFQEINKKCPMFVEIGVGVKLIENKVGAIE